MSASSTRAEVRCTLCPHACRIPEGGAGDCRIRVNRDGRLLATTFGRPSSVHVDPMEKKPMFHFLPGSQVFSLATAGCNLHCLNCQNWQLSQRGGEEMEVVYRAPPEGIVASARQARCPAIAYTYSEPLVYYEYTRETAVLAREQGLKNVLVSAGYVNPEPYRRLCRVLDGANIDLKALDDRFYREVCGATLQPVLDTLRITKEEGVWLEVTHLVIPTLNDHPAMIRRLAQWVRNELGEETPLHLSRFVPRYRLVDLPPTPVETLLQGRREALEAGLRHVYIGNVADEEGETTRCPRDGTLLVQRVGYRIVQYHLVDGRCPVCHQVIAGVWT